jgi:DNA-binding CsgD family transcriptional regulator/tetratricopeptide (TPR) repeat protein
MAGTPSIVGRERDLAMVEAAFGKGGPRLLLITGAPGSGKSTLWAAAVAAARDRGLALITARPDPNERDLPFAGLSDLLDEHTLEVVLPRLSGPRRRALEAALQRSGPMPPEPAPDRRGPPLTTTVGPLDRVALGLAVLDALRWLAASRQLVVAVDDLDAWDEPTGSAVGFAVRRLRDEPVLLLATRRTAADSAAARVIEAAVAEGAIDHLELAALSLGATGRLLGDRLRRHFPRPILVRLHQASGGNPLLALELGRSYGDASSVQDQGILLAKADLEALFRRRVDRLPPAGRDVLLTVALVGRTPVVTLESVLGARDAEAGLEATVTAELVTIDADVVRPVHPLIAWVAQRHAPPRRRRSLHRRLGALTADPEERARHLALGSDGPSETVATVLDAAADRARRRGAPAAAAELRDLAVAQTPQTDAHGLLRRIFAAARDQFEAGDALGARQRVGDALAGLAPGGARVPWLLLRAEMADTMHDRDATEVSCEQALLEAGSDARLAARTHAFLAGASLGAVALDTAHARAAIDLMAGHEQDEPAAVVTAILTLANNELWAGRGLDRALLDQALALEPQAGLPLLWRPSAQVGSLLARIDELGEARRRMEVALQTAEREGNETARPSLLAHLVSVELLLGDLAAASTHIDEALELAELCGFELPPLLAYRAWVDAHQGNVERARRVAGEGVAAADLQGDGWSAWLFHRPLGLLELSLGQPRTAAQHLLRVVELASDFETMEPNSFRVHGDLVEALVASGQLVEARTVLVDFEARAAAHGYPWSVAVSRRARGLYLAAEGDLGAASERLASALEIHAALPMPFELARTLLIAGAVHRRAKRRTDARAALEEAAAAFAGMGAHIWAARARSELASVAGRRADPGRLSPSERRVAELVANGRSNQEVADELFLSVRTVEGHLGRIYGKLGLRGRTQVAAALARQT